MGGAEDNDVNPSPPIAQKNYTSGTHRIIPPEQTLAQVRPFFPVIGITRVADITGLDTIGIPVALAYRPNSRSVVVAQGKGLTVAAAKASAVMESIETFMAERIMLPLKLGSTDDLRFSHPLADIGALPRTTASRYHRDLPILWIEGHDLFSGTPTWVPYETVHTARTLPAPTGTGCFLESTNGLASGNHFLEAVSHALCEVVERDAATLHCLRASEEVAARRLDIKTVDDPDCLAALDRLDRAGLSTGVWDITTDVAIPAFTCVIAEHKTSAPRLMYGSAGMGCHPNRAIALVRAITEAVQVRLTLITGARDNPTRREYALAMDPELMRRQAAVLDGEAAGRDFRVVPSFDSDSFDADLAWELAALRSAGITQAIVVDLTREEFGIPVVRVVVPGLEGQAGLEPPCRPGRRAMDLVAVR
jgi:ribosomal protein S12 methylthiotransferase accessory factor